MSGYVLMYNSLYINCIYNFQSYQWIEYDRKDNEKKEKLMQENQVVDEVIPLDSITTAISRLKFKFGADQISSDCFSHLFLTPTKQGN